MLYCTVLYCTTLYYTVLYTVTRWFNEGDQYPDTDNTAIYRWVGVEFLNINIVMIMSRAEVCGGHGTLRPAGVGGHGGGGLRHGDAPHGREAGQVGTVQYSTVQYSTVHLTGGRLIRWVHAAPVVIYHTFAAVR